MLQLNDVLKQMEERDHRRRPVPFHVEFVTADGDLVSMENVVLAKSRTPEQTTAPAPRKHPGPARPANEWGNATRNIYQLDSQQIRKLHIRAITQFNHQDTIY